MNVLKSLQLKQAQAYLLTLRYELWPKLGRIKS